MRVSIAWIAVILILGILFFFTFQGVCLYEQFKDKEAEEEETTEGFQGQESATDLNITTCPAETKSFIVGGGRTVCCDGTVSNGKCSGATVCSLSEGIAGLPTCSDWFDAYLENKGKDKCPMSMPNYYENKATNTSGCVEGGRLKDGTGPLPNKKYCNMYPKEDDDLIKQDSCTNQKIFDKTQCFSRPIKGQSKQFVSWGPYPPVVYCSAMDTGSLVPLSCIEDSTFVRVVDFWVKRYAPQYSNWKEQSVAWGPQWKLNFCSVVQKVNLDKTMKFGDLESYKVF
jgi:hypothetical protein